MISLPLGVAAHRWGALRNPVLAVSGIFYTIPSIALFSLLIPYTGLTVVTAEIGLIGYTVLILVRNVMVGLEAVPPEVIDAANGMGYRPLARLLADRAAAGAAGDHGRHSHRHGDDDRAGDDHRPDRPRRPGPAHPSGLHRELPHAAGGGDRAVDRPGPRRRPGAGRRFSGSPFPGPEAPRRWDSSAASGTGSPIPPTGAAPDGIPQRLVEHVQISAESVAIGALIALPIGIALGHYGRFGNLAINISNVGRAMPSFGILVIAFQVFGLGDFPIVLRLTALAIPPMLTNTYVALREVDPDVKDAARGMGYRELTQVLRVELPLAVPLADGRRPHLGRPGGGDRDPGRPDRGRRVRAVHHRRPRPAGLREAVCGRPAGGAAGDGHRAVPRGRGTAAGPSWNPPPAGSRHAKGGHIQDRINGRIKV